MRTDTRLGTYNDVLALAKGPVARLLNAARDLVVSLDPDTVEVPRPGEKSVAYGLGPKKMSEAYVYLMPQKGYLNLGFYHGADLADPDGLLEGTGKALRHVKLASLDEVGSRAVRRLIETAIDERRRALGV